MIYFISKKNVDIVQFRVESDKQPGDFSDLLEKYKHDYKIVNVVEHADPFDHILTEKEFITLDDCKPGDEVYYYGAPAKLLHNFGNGECAIEILTHIYYHDEGYMDHYKLPDYQEPIFQTLIVNHSTLSVQKSHLEEKYKARAEELNAKIDTLLSELRKLEAHKKSQQKIIDDYKGKNGFYVNVLDWMEKLRTGNFNFIVVISDYYHYNIDVYDKKTNLLNRDWELITGFKFKNNKAENYILFDGDRCKELMFFDTIDQVNNAIYQKLSNLPEAPSGNAIIYYKSLMSEKLGFEKIPIFEDAIKKEKEIDVEATFKKINSLEQELAKYKRKLHDYDD